MRTVRAAGGNAGVIKYDLLTALGAHACAGDKHLQRLTLRFITLIVARYNWQGNELAVGQREIAALWGVDERTVKRDLARLRALGWIEVRRPAARGRVAVHGLAIDRILGATSAAWTRVGPDFALRMGATPPPVPQGAPGNVISFPLVPKPQGQGVWAEVQAALHAENPALYATWFAALLAVEGPGGRLSLRAPSRFHAAFLTTHHLARIRELVQAHAPEVTTVSIDA